MTSSSKLTSFTGSIGSMVSKVCNTGGSHPTPPSSTPNTDTICEDGRMYDWPFLRRSSTLVRDNHKVLCNSKARLSDAAVLEPDEVLSAIFKKVKADRRAYQESLYMLNMRLTNASYLGLPTETDIKAQETMATVSLDPKDKEDDMSEAFSQMLDFISRQEGPCDGKTMEMLTEGKPEHSDLHSALKSRR